MFLLIMLIAIILTGCDDTTTPEKDEDFILAVMVLDTGGQPLEGMTVWKQTHLEGTVPYFTSSAAAHPLSVPSAPQAPDSLSVAYPNPFNGVITIRYNTSDVREAMLEVEDWRGRHVKTVIDGVVPEGAHEVQWDQRDESGDKVITGVYTLKLTLTDTLDIHLFTYSAELKCTNYDDFFFNSFVNDWSMGKTNATGFFSTRDLDFFPSLQGHGLQDAYNETADQIGTFSFSDTVTIRVSMPLSSEDEWIYHMSRDIALVDGPNYLEFAFVPDDSTSLVTTAR
jgi:hypothetical protein